MKNNERPLWKAVNQFEIYLSAWIFIGMTILLFVQVITRYCFNRAITWTEELSCILFVWLTYLGVAAAVRTRKHLRVDVILMMLPFNAKRICLLIGNLVSMVCFGLLIGPMMELVKTFMKINAHSDLLKIPKAVAYGVVPVCMVLTIIRYIQDSIVLMKESEEKLGTSEPVIDVAALEQEARERGYLSDEKEKGEGK